MPCIHRLGLWKTSPGCIKKVVRLTRGTSKNWLLLKTVFQFAAKTPKRFSNYAKFCSAQATRRFPKLLRLTIWFRPRRSDWSVMRFYAGLTKKRELLSPLWPQRSEWRTTSRKTQVKFTSMKPLQITRFGQSIQLRRKRLKLFSHCLGKSVNYLILWRTAWPQSD